MNGGVLCRRPRHGRDCSAIDGWMDGIMRIKPKHIAVRLILRSLFRYTFYLKVSKVHPCTGTEALYRP